MTKKYKLEADVDDFVKEQFRLLNLEKLQDYNEKSSMSEYLKSALKGSAKTANKSNFGQPDFTIEKYHIPVVIENKLHSNKHISTSKDGSLKMDDKSIRDYAVNGAVYYAKNMIASKKYGEVIAIGISGEDEESIEISTFYVFSSILEPKKMSTYSNLNFLENENSFNAFYKDATITEAEKHRFLVESRDEILKQAKKLNKLMDSFNISVEQRVVYVSGMLLAMQDVVDENDIIIVEGLVPENLRGIKTEQNRDSKLILAHVEEFLSTRNIADDKKRIMIDSFKTAICIDAARDTLSPIHKNLGDLLQGQASVTKQVFTFLYNYVFLAIDLSHGALDIMAEMYSTFLKYALSDGAQLGKVLTPPYVTSLMAKLLDINKDSKVMDVATGSAAFLVASMERMVNDANTSFGKNTTKAKDEIRKIKNSQLLGVEIDAKMYTLAATNMILRGDGSTKILKADTFKTPKSIYEDFEADRLLLNPPFSAEDFGLPFFEFGLKHMKKGGLGAVIIMDSAGAGKAVKTAKKILAHNKMIASIKMPSDLFIPNAIVQTSIYIFEAGTPHNFDYDKVKFIDFRNDGYKRTSRCIKDVDSPIARYEDLYLIYKLGYNALSNPNFHSNVWNISDVYCEDTISDKGNDWNFEKHFSYSDKPTIYDFADTIKRQTAWQM